MDILDILAAGLRDLRAAPLYGLAVGVKDSIHVDGFPQQSDYPDDEKAQDHGDQAIEVLKLVRRYKSTAQLNMGAQVGEVRVSGLSFDPATEPLLIGDLAHACRCESLVGTDGALSGDGVLSEGRLQIQVAPIEATA